MKVESGDSKGRRYRITPSSKEASRFDGKVAGEEGVPLMNVTIERK